MSNPTSVVVLGDTLAQFLARANQFSESNQDLIQQKFNKKQATGSTLPVFTALESRSRAVAQWANLMDDFILAFFADASGAGLVLTGTGTPEGVVTANVGTLYLDNGVTAADGPVVYSKETGTGNTGWIAMGPERAGAAVFGRGQLGSHTVAGTETLTADTSWQDLTVPTGTILQTNGFRLTIRDFIDVQSAAAIRINGVSASGTTIGTGAPGGSVGPGTDGGAAGANGAGGAGVNPVADTSGGGPGGGGGAGDGGAGGAAGTFDGPDADQGSIELGLPHLAAVVGFDAAGPGAIIVLSGGPGGGGGAGDGAARPGGAGGGGAGVMILCTPVLTNNGTIQAIGGDGGDADAGGNTGGGGGGGGGLIIRMTRFESGTGTFSVLGGAGGALGGTGTVGTAGSAGGLLRFPT